MLLGRVNRFLLRRNRVGNPLGFGCTVLGVAVGVGVGGVHLKKPPRSQAVSPCESLLFLCLVVQLSAWMSTTAAQAEQAAAQAQAAASAYEAAFAMTVAPAVIAANRSQTMLLIATNILGQNTPAIAANEAHYGEMWAQDSAAMYAYAGSSAAASKLTLFTSPPQTTNPAGLAGQAATESVNLNEALLSGIY